jgi:hypothetical protein
MHYPNITPVKDINGRRTELQSENQDQQSDFHQKDNHADSNNNPPSSNERSSKYSFPVTTVTRLKTGSIESTDVRAVAIGKVVSGMPSSCEGHEEEHG